VLRSPREHGEEDDLAATLRTARRGLVIVVLAYVCGRAVGILLDLNPYVTETAAVALVLVAAAWARTRGDRGE
jgi:hypothetical protein